MIIVEVDPGLAGPLPVEGLERAAGETLRQQSAPDSDLTIVLADDERLRSLNRDFLGRDASTDVLSFPAGESDPETGRPYLGDVVISVPRALEQALAGGHPLDAELQLLVVHGVLHLLGHDHAGGDEKARMWAAQAEVLERIGLGGLSVQEE